MKILRRTLSRRSFLKLGTAGAAAAAFPQIVPSGTLFGAATPSSRLNVAIIGVGNRSRALIPAILEEKANIAALCDVDPMQITRVRTGAPGVDGKKFKGADL